MSFVHCQMEESKEKLSRLLHYKIMSKVNTPRVKYIPPQVGTMEMTIQDSYSKSDAPNIMSRVDHSHVMEATMGQTENVATLLLYSLNNSKLRLKEGLAMANAIINETHDRIGTLAKILPHMLNPIEARMLIGRVSE